MERFPELKGENIILRKPIERDIIERYSCGRTHEWVKTLGGDTRNMQPMSLEEAKQWFERVAARPNEWAIEFEGKCIGTARLTVDHENKSGRYAVGIFDTNILGNGIGTEVTKLVLQYAFETLNLHRVDLRVLEYNKRAIRCYEKCGFVIEGRIREGALIEDKWETDIMMSILENEYKSRKYNERINIREMQRIDYPMMHKWLNDPLVLTYYEEPPLSIDAIRQKFDPRVEGNHYVKPCIIDYEDNPIGYIQYYEIQDEKRNKYGIGEEMNVFGIDQFIGETNLWGLGIGTIVISKMLKRLKEENAVSRVYLEVKKTNTRAIKCYKKCGFVELKELTSEIVLMECILN